MEVVDIMKAIFNLLHFSKRMPKHLLLSIPGTVPDITQEEGIELSNESEGNSQSFARNSSEIEDFILALSYSSEMLQARRIAAINAKYSKH